MLLLHFNVLSVSLVSAVAAALAAAAGWFLNNRLGRNSLDATRKRADETLRSARHEAEKVKRAALLEVKEEILAQRNKADQDLRSRRGQLLKKEKDLVPIMIVSRRYMATSEFICNFGESSGNPPDLTA